MLYSKRYLDRIAIMGIFFSLIFSSCSPGNSDPAIDEASTIPKATVTTPTETPILQVASNLVYVTLSAPEGEEQMLDVYAPPGGEGLPVVLFLHGFRGNKRGGIADSQAIAENGAVVFTITWPTWTIPTSLKDDGKLFRQNYEVISCAVKFARVKAADYGGNPDQIILAGFSWGATVGSWVALGGEGVASEWETFFSNRGGPTQQAICAADDGSAWVEGFIGIGGGFGHVEFLKEEDEELWQVLSPYSHLGQNPDLVIRLLHGESDTVVDPEESVMFNSILQEQGYDSQIILFDGFHQIPTDLVAELVQEISAK